MSTDMEALVELGAEALRKMYHGSEDEPFHLMARAVIEVAMPGAQQTEEALRQLVAAEDRFVRESGAKLDDPIEAAVKHARAVLETVAPDRDTKSNEVGE